VTPASGKVSSGIRRRPRAWLRRGDDDHLLGEIAEASFTADPFARDSAAPAGERTRTFVGGETSLCRPPGRAQRYLTGAGASSPAATGSGVVASIPTAGPPLPIVLLAQGADLLALLRRQQIVAVPLPRTESSIRGLCQTQAWLTDRKRGILGGRCCGEAHRQRRDSDHGPCVICREPDQGGHPRRRRQGIRARRDRRLRARRARVAGRPAHRGRGWNRQDDPLALRRRRCSSARLPAPFVQAVGIRDAAPVHGGGRPARGRRRGGRRRAALPPAARVSGRPSARGGLRAAAGAAGGRACVPRSPPRALAGGTYRDRDRRRPVAGPPLRPPARVRLAPDPRGTDRVPPHPAGARRQRSTARPRSRTRGRGAVVTGRPAVDRRASSPAAHTPAHVFSTSFPAPPP
jgi:hypothetical protein